MKIQFKIVSTLTPLIFHSSLLKSVKSMTKHLSTLHGFVMLMLLLEQNPLQLCLQRNIAQGFDSVLGLHSMASLYVDLKEFLNPPSLAFLVV